MKQFNTAGLFLLLMLFSVMGFANSANTTMSPPDCSLVSNSIGDFIFLGEYNNSKYYCSNTNDFTWHEAKAEAESFGGHLAIIDDAAENEFIKNSILADYVWLGLSDEANEGTFKTIFGDNAPYLNWNYGEPNNSNGNEHYVRLLKSNGKWTDRDEWFKAEYVMEIPCPDNGGGGGNPTCTGNQIISWDLDACQAYADANSYDEFTPSFSNQSTCGNITATTVHRDNPGNYYHSCLEGVAGNAMCISGTHVDYFPANSVHMLRFSVTVPAGQTLTSLSFYQKSEPHILNNGQTATISNNYLKKFALRIKKNTSGIFLSENNYTSQSDWSLESFDLNPIEFAVDQTTVFEFELVAYDPVNNGGTVRAWEIDEIKLFGCCGSNDPCQNEGGDSDDDGICDNFDCAPNNPYLPTTPGTACNDGDDNTQNDVIQADGCTCLGSSNPNNGDIVVATGPDQDICPGESVTLIAIYNNEAVCELPCNLGNEALIVDWDMEDCASFSNDGSYADYSEFTSDSDDLSCATVLSSGLYRNAGNHSCTDDPDNGDAGDAVCLGMDGDSFEDNAAKALRFDVTINPSSCLAGITKLTFKDFAPEHYLWSAEGYTPNTGTNNYPTKFGIRILKNGVEIFKQTGLNTSTNNWGLRTFDFSDNADFQSNEAALYQFELLAYDLVGNGGNISAWDLDDIKIFGGTCTPQTTNAVSYLWSNGATTASIQVAPDATTTYTVTVTDCSFSSDSDEVTITVKDADEDGVCDDFDCAPQDPSLPTTPGTTCDDNDPTTVNDIILTDGCSCAGTFDPCALLGGDTDGDGVCDEEDCAPQDASLPTTPGTACDDNDPTTVNDVILADGCDCAGTFDPCALLGGDTDGDGVCDEEDCAPQDASLPTTPGTACDDNDPTTVNDVILADGCDCAGTFDPCALLGGDTDGDGVCDEEDCAPQDASLPTTPGTACDDNDPTTVNDVILADGCDCAGTFDPCALLGGDTDGDGVCDEEDCAPQDASLPTTPGTACDDNDPTTVNDVILADGCDCAGTFDPCALLGGDTDGDGVCDEEDCAPQDASLPTTPGTACDDNDPTTINDVILADGCDCAGTFDSCALLGGDTDGDGVCDEEDCAPQDASLPTTPGTACDDNDPTTINDVILADGCDCAGTFDPCALLGGDTDGDGVCNEEDCAPLDPSLPTTPGTACDDNDPNTINDVILGDNCTCAGVEIPVPGITIDDIIVNEEDGIATLKICLDEETVVPVIVDYTTNDGSALQNSDYVAQSGMVIIPAGETCVMLQIEIVDDENPEDTEVLVVDLSNPINGEILDDQGTITILDTDVIIPGIIIFDVTVNEEDGTALLSVCLDEATTVDVTVDFETADGSAIDGSDYTAQTGTVTIEAGELCSTITIEIIDDENPEPTEELVVNLTNPTNAEIIDPQGVVTILDTDEAPLPKLTINDITVNEEDGTATLEVCLDEISDEDVTVDFATADDSANDGIDYTAQTGSLTIPAGESCAEVTIEIIDDALPEPTEELVVNLSNPTNAEIADPQGVITILDTDVTLPKLIINDIVVNEEDGTATLTVTIGVPSAEDITVTYTTADGTAIDGSDYTAATGTITIPAGELSATVTFTILDDENPELTELFVVDLSNPVNVEIADDQGTVTILDTDAPTGTCDDIVIEELDGVITTSGYSDPIVFVKVYDSGWNNVYDSGMITDGAEQIISGLPAGEYWVFVKTYDQSWNEICDLHETIVIDPPTGDDPLIAINDVTVYEEDGVATLAICLDEISDEPVTVTYTTSDGSALAGADYYESTGTATIPAGVLCTIIDIPLVDDENPEPTETFNVTLSNPVGGNIFDGTGVVTILDTDTAPNGCSDISIEANGGVITVGGYSDPIVFVKVYDDNWNIVFDSGMITNGATQTITITESGEYWVFVKSYDNSWSQVCDVHEILNVICGSDPCADLGGDSDGDGVCDDNDICPGGDDNIDTDNDGIPDFCDDAEVCIEREVSSTLLCGNTTEYGLFIRFENTHYYWSFIDDATFVEYTDGTAQLTGTIQNNVNASLKFDVDITYSGRTDVAPANSPKDHICLTFEEELLYYYPSLEGTLTGQDGLDGAVVTMSEFGPSFQVGLGANVTSSTLDFGASGWMEMEVTSQPTSGDALTFESSNDGQGDVNIMLSGDYEECLDVNITAPVSSGNNSSCNVEITSGDGSLTIGGYTQPVAIVQIFDESWTPVFSCMGDCANPLVVDDLNTGTYFVKVSLYDASWSLDCEEEQGFHEVVNSLGLESNNPEFLFFNASKDGREVAINWTTNTEFKNDHFVVERSTDGLNFAPAFDVNSIKDGNEATYYQDEDTNPMMGESFYRLKQVYADGSYRYSNMKKIIFDIDLMEFSVYPNPTVNQVFINLSEFEGLPAVIELNNPLGQKMDEFITDGLTIDPIGFNVSEFKAGMYSITVKIEGKKQMTRLFVVSKM